MNEDKKYDQIQRYLNGDLTEQEVQAFEEALTQDAELKEEMDLHLLANDAVELIVEDELRADLKQLAQKSSQKTSQSSGAKVVSLRRRLYVFGAAASVLLLLGFFAINFQSNQYSNDAIASGAYQNELLNRVRGAEDASLLQEGMTLLTQENYEEAVAYFFRVTDPALEAEAKYAAGHAHYNLLDYEKAMSNFTAVIESKDPRFVEKAEWFYLLSALADDKIQEEQPLQVLDKLINDDSHLYHQEAMAVNKKLKSFWRNF